MKVTLINAQICEANNLVPPLGILAVASFLEKHGIEVQLIDDDIFVTDFASRVLAFKPDLVGVSFLTPAFTRARKIVSTLKPQLVRARFCAGGFHPSILPEQTVRELSLDFCVIGEGETTLLEVCQRLADSKGISGVKGICYAGSDGAPVITASRELIDDLDQLPVPATHLLDYENYMRPPGLFRGMVADRIAALSTSRGCPFHCAYCGGRKLYQGRVRFRSLPSVQSELDHLVATHRIRGLWIIDECFTLDRGRAMAMADLIARYGMPWGMQTRVDLLDEPMIRHFKDRGCFEINFGVESGSDRVLGLLKKGTTRQLAERTFSWCRIAGVRTTANFMIGTPTETEAEMYETFEFSKKLKASYTVFHITTPLPGTALYEYALSAGLLEETLGFDDAWLHRGSRGPLMKTEMPPELLMKLRARFQNHYFFRNYVHWRNVRYGLHALFRLLRSPKILARSFKAFLMHGRFDSFIETLVASINNARK